MKIIRYDYAVVLCITDNIRIGYYRRGMRNWSVGFGWTVMGHRIAWLSLWCFALNMRLLRRKRLTPER